MFRVLDAGRVRSRPDVVAASKEISHHSAPCLLPTRRMKAALSKRGSRRRSDAAVFQSSASNSSIKPEMTESPLPQKAGSEASRPKGASSSEWCFVPPARSMSKYFS